MVPVWLAVGRGRSPGPRVAGPLSSAWQPSRWDRSPALCVAAVGAGPVPWAPRGRRGGVAGPLGPTKSPWGVASPWVLRGRREGVVGPLGLVWAPWGCGQFHGPCVVPLERSRSPGTRVAAVGAWLVRGPRVAAVGAWPVPWGSCGRRGGVAVPLGPVWQSWGCNPSSGPRMATLGAWPDSWPSCGRRGGVSGFLDPSWPLWWQDGSPCPARTPWMRGRSPWPRVTAAGAWPDP